MPNWTDLFSKPDAWFDDLCANCGQRRGSHAPYHPNIAITAYHPNITAECTGFVEPINLCRCGHALTSHSANNTICLTRDCGCKEFRKLVTGIHDCANCGCGWTSHQSEEDQDSTACEKCGCAHFVSSAVTNA
jgi:hypothetical protein